MTNPTTKIQKVYVVIQSRGGYDGKRYIERTCGSLKAANEYKTYCYEADKENGVWNAYTVQEQKVY